MTDAQLQNQNETLLADNVVRAISEEDLRTVIQYIIENKINVDKIGIDDGVCGLDSDSLVPAVNLPAATTEAAGAVMLAEDGDDTEGLVVQANDSRLSSPEFGRNTSAINFNIPSYDFDLDLLPASMVYFRTEATLNSNCELRLSGGSDGDIIEIYVRTANNGFSLSFDSSIKWTNSAPTISGSSDNLHILQFRKIGGEYWGGQIK